MAIWKNPEFIRYVRVALRPVRLVGTMGTALAIAALIALGIWGTRSGLERALADFFVWISGIQLGLLGLGCAYCCGQTVSQERLMKTFDFLRTTRMSSLELTIGILFGAPVQIYLLALCMSVSALPAAIIAGIGIGVIVRMYVLLILTALFSSLLGLCVSVLGDRSSAGVAILLVLLGGTVPAPFANSFLPGLAALSPIPAFLELLPDGRRELGTALVFGVPVAFLAMTALLYVGFGVWVMLATVRNMKKDVSEMRPLSRWQAMGLLVFLNVLFYAVVRWDSLTLRSDFVTAVMTLNAVILFLVGISTASPREELKTWWRARRHGSTSYFSEAGLSWPWIVIAAGIAFSIFLCAVGVIRGVSSKGLVDIEQGALQLTVFLIFIVRDVSFLQLCGLTYFKRPFAVGLLCLSLYYVAAIVMAAAFAGVSGIILSVMTPYGVFTPGWNHSGTWIGAALQAAITGILLWQSHDRLERIVAIPATP